jgi:hypothetical protein
MKLVPVDYTTFWSLVSSKTLLPQYSETVDTYYIFAIEDSISWEVTVPKDSGANQIDFETNHKETCNQPLEYRSVDGLPMVASAMFTDALGFWVDGSNGYLQISAGQTAYSVTNFSVPYRLNGVDIQWANANAGDYVNFDVGVYSGGDPTNQSTFIQMAQFANQYRLYGNAEKSFILDTVSTVPPTYNGLNVYIRTTYVNTGANTVMLFVNLLGYK